MVFYTYMECGQQLREGQIKLLSGCQAGSCKRLSSEYFNLVLIEEQRIKYAVFI